MMIFLPSISSPSFLLSDRRLFVPFEPEEEAIIIIELSHLLKRKMIPKWAHPVMGHWAPSSVLMVRPKMMVIAYRTQFIPRRAQVFRTQSPSSLSYMFHTFNNNNVNLRNFSSSSSPAIKDDDRSSVVSETAEDLYRPRGELLDANQRQGPDSWLGKTASIRRVFEANSNAIGLLTCGGEQLARHASFDPDYDRAQGWIRRHAVGPAVLSPVLISGLVGALVEAAFPQSVPVSSSSHQIRPLIVSSRRRLAN